MEVIEFISIFYIKKKETILDPHCNPSIFSDALLPANATLQESIPKDYMEWSSIMGIYVKKATHASFFL